MRRKLLKKICFLTRNDAGVQLVELAIVLPVLLMLFVVVHLLEIVAAGFFTRVRSMITGKEPIRG